MDTRNRAHSTDEPGSWIKRVGETTRGNWLTGLTIGLGIATVAVTAILAARTSLTGVDAVIISTTFVTLGSLVLLVMGREAVVPTLDHVSDRLDSLSRRNVLLQHEGIALQDPILRDEYIRIVGDFSQGLASLAAGHFARTIDDVTHLSIEIVSSLREEAFATVIFGETDQIFFQFRSSREFLQECYKAAKRIRPIRKFTRLFVVNDLTDVTPQRYDLMEEHAREEVNVLV